MLNSLPALASSPRRLVARRQARQRLYLLLGIALTTGLCALTGRAGAAPLVISTTSLPSGKVGTAYSATLAATGGTKPSTWSLTSGKLPTGLSLSPSAGAITGTPSATATNLALTFKVTDSSKPVQTKSVNLALTIAAPALAVTTTSLPSGKVGTAYSATLAATGGTKPFAWSLTSGKLPSGLALNPTTGAITGTPSAPATNLALTFKVTDSGSPVQTKSVNLTLTIAPLPLAITTTSLPGGTVGTAYSATLAATGGTTPFTWSLTSGTLPTGLSLNAATGAITGTPSVPATNLALTFKVADSGSPVQTKPVNLTLTIAPLPLAITTTSLLSGKVGTAYSATLAATGGTKPFAWSLTSGKLPSGLALNPSSGAITGTPSAPATNLALTFKVTDSGSPVQTKSVNLALTIAPLPLAITTTSLPNADVGTAYSATLAATGGTTPFTWSLASGTLPTGLSLNAATGAITGTPSDPATNLALTFKVTDSGSPVQTKSVNLTLTVVTLPLAISTTSLPSGKVGTVYSASLAATGGTPPFTWAVTAGGLPTGLALSPSTGAVTGTPSAPANKSAITFKVTDSGSPVQTKSVNLALTIAPLPLAITTTSLPSGRVAAAYSATLVATGGTTPFTWSITSGTLPAGLSLNPATGAITGTPSAAAANLALTFKVADAGDPVQSQSVSLPLTIAPPPLVIQTTSLPFATFGIPYSATLAATGGTQPFLWEIFSGALPAGLSLNSSTGLISGTPSAQAANPALTFEVEDSGSPAQTKSVNLALAAGPLLVLPARAGLAMNQILPVSAIINDSAGVTWSASGSGCSGAACGVFSSSTSLSGVSVTYTAPSTPGVYTITATGVTNTAATFSSTIGVTDLAGVTTYHNDQYRDGANTQEYALTPSNVTAATFGKLASCPVDGAVYAQPLWVPNLTINSARHNVVIVATQADSLFAFDADTNGACTPLWHASMLDAAHGATHGETSVVSFGPNHQVGGGGGDITPEVGVTSTPVIDLATSTIYALAKSVVSSDLKFFQRLHAIDLLTGNEKFSGPATIAATFPGTGDGGATITFNPQTQAQRPGLTLANGVVYIAWASHEDHGDFHGWIMGYGAADLAQKSVLNLTPNSNEGGIWMSGGAPAVDANNNIYFITANGGFDATSASPPNNDYGDSFMELTTNLTVSQYFTPSDELNDDDRDMDFGSGGPVLIDLPPNGKNPTHLAAGGGKDGTLYLLNRDAMGGFGTPNAWQGFTVNGGIFSTGAYWNSNFYISDAAGVAMYKMNPATAMLTQSVASATPHDISSGQPTPSISSTPANTNGILWALDNVSFCTGGSHSCGPAVLHAYDATNLVHPLWNSSQGSANAAGLAVKFTVPTVANGRVFIGTRGNNIGGNDASTSTPGELDIYGLLPD